MPDLTPDPVDELTEDEALRRAARAVPHGRHRGGSIFCEDLCARYRLDIARAVLDAVAPEREEWGVHLDEDPHVSGPWSTRSAAEEWCANIARRYPTHFGKPMPPYTWKVRKVRTWPVGAPGPWRDPEPASAEEGA